MWATSRRANRAIRGQPSRTSTDGPVGSEGKQRMILSDPALYRPCHEGHSLRQRAVRDDGQTCTPDQRGMWTPFHPADAGERKIKRSNGERNGWCAS